MVKLSLIDIVLVVRDYRCQFACKSRNHRLSLACECLDVCNELGVLACHWISMMGCLGFCRFAVQEHFQCMDLGLIDFVDLSSSVLVMLKTL